MDLNAEVLTYLVCTPMIVISQNNSKNNNNNITTVASVAFIDAGFAIMETGDTLDMSCKTVTTGLR